MASPREPSPVRDCSDFALPRCPGRHPATSKASEFSLGFSLSLAAHIVRGAEVSAEGAGGEGVKEISRWMESTDVTGRRGPREAQRTFIMEMIV